MSPYGKTCLFNEQVFLWKVTLDVRRDFLTGQFTSICSANLFLGNPAKPDYKRKKV